MIGQTMMSRRGKLRRGNERGAAIVEFTFISLSLIPLLLGGWAVGMNLAYTLQNAQLARDAGHLFARGMDFSEPGNQTILYNIGSWLGLSSSGSSGAEVILSSLTYVDQAACASAGAVDSYGNPSGCTNYQQWVFTQRLVIGNSGLSNSVLGAPTTSPPNGVTIDPDTGKISLADYVLQSGAVATFSAINPYANVAGVISGLPSGQYLYIAESYAQSFTIPPFVSGSTLFSYGIF